ERDAHRGTGLAEEILDRLAERAPAEVRFHPGKEDEVTLRALRAGDVDPVLRPLQDALALLGAGARALDREVEEALRVELRDGLRVPLRDQRAHGVGGGPMAVREARERRYQDGVAQCAYLAQRSERLVHG